MSVKVISKDSKSVTLEVTIAFDQEHFLQTEEHIMDRVNEVGAIATKEALESLEISEKVITVNEKKLYAKKN